MSRALVLGAVTLSATLSAVGLSDAVRPVSAITVAPSGRPLPKIADAEEATTVEQGEARALKAKVQVSLPPLYLRGPYVVCGRFADQGPQAAPCPPEFRANISSKYLFSPRQILGGYASYYVATKVGSDVVYGRFPSVRVKALAFGSVPVEATLTLTQSTIAGYIEPLRVELSYFANLDTSQAGKPSWPGYPPVPSTDGAPISFALNLRTTIKGPLDINLSNVTVDGRQIDVGSTCRTMKPAQLSVDTARGFYDGTGSLGFTRGTPSGFIAINDLIAPPGTFDGSIDIPSFAGCQASGQNLDALLTSFVSGKNNPLSGFLPVAPLNDTWCTKPIADCTSTQIAGEQRMHKLAAAIRANRSLADIRRLQAQIKPQDRVLPRLRARQP